MMLLTRCQWCFILKIAFRCRRLGKIGQSDPWIDLLLLSHRAWSDMGDHENDGCRCLEATGGIRRPDIDNFFMPVAAEMEYGQ